MVFQALQIFAQEEEGTRSSPQVANRLSGRLWWEIERNKSCSVLEITTEELDAIWDSLPALVEYTDFSTQGLKELFDTIPAPNEASNQKNYGDDWPTVRQEVLKRDDYECQRCGLVERAHKEEYGVSLHIHHKTPIEQFDDVEYANRISNLVALCARCHRIRES